jgi:hypothetical protein
MRSSGPRGQALVFSDVLSARDRSTQRYAPYEQVLPAHLRGKAVPLHTLRRLRSAAMGAVAILTLLCKQLSNNTMFLYALQDQLILAQRADGRSCRFAG